MVAIWYVTNRTVVTKQTVTPYREATISAIRTPLNRDRIVSGAFRAWGKTMFSQTSLNLVARELSVTKTAIYRYFRGKSELLLAMEKAYAERVLRDVVAPLRALKDEWYVETMSAGEHIRIDLHDRIAAAAKRYLESMFDLFNTRPAYYLFFAHTLLGRPLRERPTMRALERERDAILAELLSCGSNTSDDATLTVAWYLTHFVTFWATQHFRRRFMERPVETVDVDIDGWTTTETGAGGWRVDASERRRILDGAVARFTDGFVPGTLHHLDLAAVERVAWINREEVRKPERIFSAIGETVMELGYGAATVERIAGRSGLSKSGLYHYFKNRDEMLSEALLRTQRHFAALARVRLNQLGGHNERLYGTFVMVASYLFHDATGVVVANWLQERDVDVQIPPSHLHELERMYSFITDELVESRLADSTDDAVAVLTYINFLIKQLLSERRLPRENRDKLIAAVRSLFELFAGGAHKAITHPTLFAAAANPIPETRNQ